MADVLCKDLVSRQSIPISAGSEIDVSRSRSVKTSITIAAQSLIVICLASSLVLVYSGILILYPAVCFCACRVRKGCIEQTLVGRMVVTGPQAVVP